MDPVSARQTQRPKHVQNYGAKAPIYPLPYQSWARALPVARRGKAHRLLHCEEERTICFVSQNYAVDGVLYPLPKSNKLLCSGSGNPLQKPLTPLIPTPHTTTYRPDVYPYAPTPVYTPHLNPISCSHQRPRCLLETMLHRHTSSPNIHRHTLRFVRQLEA